MQYEHNNFKHFFLDAWSINYGSTVEFLLKSITDGHDKHIIDIGCGDGRFSRELALAFPSASVVGVDYSRRAIALASAMNPDISNLTFQPSDITQEHGLGAFDIAVLMEVFEHIPLEETGIFIKSVHALLHRGGTLYLTVPHANKPLEYKHFQHFTVESMSECLTPYFEISEVVPFEKISWLRAIVLNVLSNKLFILKSPGLLSKIYRWYKNNLFLCSSEKECQRIFLKAVAR
jgi:SAM-dependent methyltransferase